MNKYGLCLLFLICPLVLPAAQNWKAIIRYDKQQAKTDLQKRFLRYAGIDSHSLPGTEQLPSTKEQMAFAKILAKELKQIGASQVQISKTGVVRADIATTTAKPAATLVLMAPLDTPPLLSQAPLRPQVHAKYIGGDISLQTSGNTRLTEQNSPQLLQAHGHDIITTSGDNLMGAHAKSGLAIVMTLADYLLGNPSVEHGPIKLVFYPDSVSQAGPHALDISTVKADYAYVLETGDLGEISTENFTERTFTAIFEGNRGEDPGLAIRNGFSDNLLMASDFHTLLPRHQRPENTTNRRGYILVSSISTQQNRSTITGVLRAFSDSELDELAQAVIQAFNTVKAMNPKRTAAQLTFTNRFTPGAKATSPIAFKQLQQALQQEEIPIKRVARRMVTDREIFSQQGVPSLGIFNGSFHSPGPLEYVDIDVMEASLRSLLASVSILP